jgi:uncharacterized protein (TIGR03437 family)
MVHAFQPVIGGGTGDCPVGAGDGSDCHRDAWVAKFNSTGSSLVYSTFLGGSGTDEASGIAVDSQGNAYVTGYTMSSDFPTALPLQDSFAGNGDIFVTKFDAAGSLVYSTYFGGTDLDGAQGIALDGSGSIYLAGATNSTNFPIANALIATVGPPVPTSCFCNAEGVVVKLTLPPPQLAPQITSGSAVNGASFTAVGGLAPGSIFTIFGSNLAPDSVEVGGTPLPASLLSTSILIGGVAAPLFFISPSQINAQVPFEATPGNSTLTVRVSGMFSAVVPLEIAAAAPGIFLYDGNRAVAQNQDGSLNGPDHPSNPGDVMVLYFTGQGAVNNPVATGAAAPANPLSSPIGATSVSVGGVQAVVRASVLTPGFVGLAQVNFVVPGVSAGDQLVIVNIGGAESNPALIRVAAPVSP